MQRKEKEWIEKNGIIHFSVISDGSTGEEWITKLRSKGRRIDDGAKSYLLSGRFKPTRGVTYEVVILKGKDFHHWGRRAIDIYQEALNIGLTMPPAEIACLAREKFSNMELKKMGIYGIIVLHEQTSNFDKGFLAFSYDNGDWFYKEHDDYVDGWDSSFGFAFITPQILNF